MKSIPDIIIKEPRPGDQVYLRILKLQDSIWRETNLLGSITLWSGETHMHSLVKDRIDALWLDGQVIIVRERDDVEDPTGEWVAHHCDGYICSNGLRFGTPTGSPLMMSSQQEAVTAAKNYVQRLIENAEDLSKECDMNTKPSNPKDVVGSKKVPFHLIPCGTLTELSLAMLEGSLKYGSHNYRKVGVRASIYYDAALRHLMAWWEGEDLDPDSGLSHLTKAMACLVVLQDSKHTGNWSDDRPPKSLGGALITWGNNIVSSFISKVKNPVKPFTQLYIEGVSNDGK